MKKWSVVAGGLGFLLGFYTAGVINKNWHQSAHFGQHQELVQCQQELERALFVSNHQHHHGASPSCPCDASSAKTAHRTTTRTGSGGGDGAKSNNPATATSYFPEQVEPYLVGMRRVERSDFERVIDLGIPRDDTEEKVLHGRLSPLDVTILYSSPNTLPVTTNAGNNDTTSFMPRTSMDHATQHCDYLNVVLTRVPGRKGASTTTSDLRQCWALVPLPQSEAFHVHRYARIDPVHRKGKSLIQRTLPLRLIGRGVRWFDGHDALLLGPRNEESSVQPSWQALKLYTTQLSTVQEQVSTLVKTKLRTTGTINNDGRNRTTIVSLTTNQGQAEFLTNFVCTARSRRLSLERLLVFALDNATAKLCDELGIVSYYNPDLFGHIPSSEGPYGGAKFAIIAMAKLWVPHILSSLGYDFLFQDVDVVWYRNPLDYFLSMTNEQNQQTQHDIIFMDDGSRSPHMAPFYANTGFYFSVNNDRTRNFFTKLVTFGGETLLRHNCDQLATNVLLAEHTSLYGLKVKVLSRSLRQFLSGYHVRRTGLDHHTIQELLLPKKAAPPNNNISLSSTSGPLYMFHACWTANKKDKIAMLTKLREWRVQTVSCPSHQAFCCSTRPMGVA